MPVETRLSVGPDALPLSLGSDRRLEYERVAPVGVATTPYVWVRDEGPTRTIADASLTVRGDGADLVRVERTAPSTRVLDSLADADATCLRAVGENGRWVLTLRFPSQADLTAWYRSRRDGGRDVRVQYVHDAARRSGPSDALSAPQREALAEAYRGGYFDVPRDLTLEGLAERLDVSDTAASQRLRRGIAALVEAEVVEGEPALRS